MGENRQGGNDRNNPSSMGQQGQPHERQDQQRQGSVDRQQNQQGKEQQQDRNQQQRRDQADRDDKQR
ncbi:hypothetical protein [Rhizorhabdus wittichii]|jgi:hypothetical protein|uniref:Uncharacterized protein n=1 Tax=Rhizorhabdus wittichii TaxID=160791 RepID=A0A975D606_9SPHN|nr:hypothetical protein [Rhizorhabdus wittichii]ARR52220.1 hypothetical protein HY78_01470 [Rhizorhabdus wittichii DC-6]QTH23448.1 hypothetical protein HRJ34_08105 [Rhizorhabdus wittichii]